MARPRNYSPRLVPKDFATKLATALEQRGVQRKLAQAIGRSESTISKFVTNPPRSSRLVEPICEFFKWSLPPEAEDLEIAALGQWHKEGNALVADWGPEELLEALDWLRKWKAMRRVELEATNPTNDDDPDES
jgi:hypothetical protein